MAPEGLSPLSCTSKRAFDFEGPLLRSHSWAYPLSCFVRTWKGFWMSSVKIPKVGEQRDIGVRTYIYIGEKMQEKFVEVKQITTNHFRACFK